MNCLKLLQSKIAKTKEFSSIIFASLIAFSSCVGVISISQASNLTSESNVAAYINFFTSGVRILRAGEEEQTPEKDRELRRYEEHIKVPGSEESEFFHLFFKTVYKEQNALTPLIQAGPNYTKSLYYFPCKVYKGDFMVGWDIERVGTDKKVCDSFNVQIVQSSSENITISPTDNLTLIHIQNNDANRKIDVLLGAVTIKSPTGSFNVEQGESYFNNGQREETQRPSIRLYAAKRVSIFLNKDYWSEEAYTQVQDFIDVLYQNPLIRGAIEYSENNESEQNNETTKTRINIPEFEPEIFEEPLDGNNNSPIELKPGTEITIPGTSGAESPLRVPSDIDRFRVPSDIDRLRAPSDIDRFRVPSDIDRLRVPSDIDRFRVPSDIDRLRVPSDRR